MEAESVQQTGTLDDAPPASVAPHPPTRDASGATRGKQRLSRNKDRARKRRQLQELRKRLMPAGA